MDAGETKENHRREDEEEIRDGDEDEDDSDGGDCVEGEYDKSGNIPNEAEETYDDEEDTGDPEVKERVIVRMLVIRLSGVEKYVQGQIVFLVNVDFVQKIG